MKPEVCPTSGLPFLGDARGVPHPPPCPGYRTHYMAPSMTAAQHSERKLPAKRSQYVVRHHEAGCCAVLASEEQEALMWDRHHACSTASPRVAELFR